MTTCVHCDYTWEYGGELEKATCPSCNLKTPVEKETVPRNDT